MARNMPHPATLAAQGLGWTDPSTGAQKPYLAAVATFGAGLSFLF